MLKQRILTALFLIPIIIVVIFFPPTLFLFVSGLFVLGAAWEWAHLSGINDTSSKIIYVGVVAISLAISLLIPLSLLTALGIMFWLGALLLIFLYPRGTYVWSSVVARAAMGVIVLVLFWLGSIILQNSSPLWFLFVLLIVWGADAGAYFAGKKWGQHKLVFDVSPGKTVEGFVGGIVTVLLIAIIGILFLDIPSGYTISYLLICLIGGGILTVVGDLFESMLKRYKGVKDSGNLLPGHGGILDRIDSLTPTIPFFAWLLPYVLSNF